MAQSDHYGTQSYSGAIEGSGIGRYTPYVLSIVRIVVALLILQHGLSRLFGFPSPLPSPAMFSLYWFAGAIELVGGILLLGGLFTRSAAFILSGEMAFAYFLSHAPNELLPDPQPRRRRDPVLLHLPVHRLCRARSVEPGRYAAAHARLAPSARPLAGTFDALNYGRLRARCRAPGRSR